MNRVSSPTTTLLALAFAGRCRDGADTSRPRKTYREGASSVRIVQLSFTHGEVKIDRKTGHGFEPAFPNLPITQGVRLKTAEGVAEIEFEDESTFRLANSTTVEVLRLQRTATGATINEIKVLKGMVYVALEQRRGNIFVVTCDRGRIVLPPSSHIRLSVDSLDTQLAVLDGTARVQIGNAIKTVGKNSTLLVTTSNQTAPTLVDRIQSEPGDPWDKAQTELHKRHANAKFTGSK